MPNTWSQPVFDAILTRQARALSTLLRADPALARRRIDEDAFVESVPHTLYVGDTLLHVAAAAVRLGAAKALIFAGADVNASNRRGARPLHYACDPRPSSIGGWNTPAQVELIHLLVKSGADPEAADKAGVRALHRAVRSRSPAAVGALLLAGADPNARAGKGGSVPLELTETATGASGVAGTATQNEEIITLLRSAGAR